MYQFSHPPATTLGDIIRRCKRIIFLDLYHSIYRHVHRLFWHINQIWKLFPKYVFIYTCLLLFHCLLRTMYECQLPCNDTWNMKKNPFKLVSQRSMNHWSPTTVFSQSVWRNSNEDWFNWSYNSHIPSVFWLSLP